MQRAVRVSINLNPQGVAQILLQAHEIEHGGTRRKVDQEVKIARGYSFAPRERSEDPRPQDSVLLQHGSHSIH